MRTLYWLLPATILAGLYLMALGAPFLAPYSHTEQFRELFYAPPTRVRFVDREEGLHVRPFIYDYERVDDTPRYRGTGRRLHLYFLVEGRPYRWMGMTFRTHLFGLADPSKRIFLLGSDALGRDLFSRILYGAQFSLTIGLVGILFIGVVGVVFGATAGYFGGWADRVVMRLSDLFLSLPGLFLILGIRAVFPLELGTFRLYWLIVLIFTLLGWAVVARVIRGQVLSLKTRDHVTAARAAGASHWRILRKHILPFTGNYLLVQSTILVPACILGEITLSFLGVGVQEPDASWGNLLTGAASVRVLRDFPWLLAPAAFIFAATFCFNWIGDQLKVRGRLRLSWL